MTASEKAWAKENGLKKTNMITWDNGKLRIVYKANNGRLYYISCNQYVGTWPEYCEIRNK